ncbi:30S ribosomal protein S20 [Patescibacteria group bacterium]
MPNTKSAKKALRGSNRKRLYNAFWKKRIKSSTKNLERALATKKASTDILNKELVVLQKALDKAIKKDVIHKNKANRLKSRYAKKIAAQAQTKSSKPKPVKKPGTKS